MINFRHSLPKKVGLKRREQFVLEYCSGKRVLHLGCTDAGLTEDRIKAGRLLHSELSKVTARLYGVDIDQHGLDRLRSLGHDHLFLFDVHHLNEIILPGPVDIVLASEILEHLDNPGDFLNATHRFLSQNGGGELLLTVPNATSVRNIIAGLANRELVHPDHNYYFSVVTLATILHKHGFQVISAHPYSETPLSGSAFKSAMKRLLQGTLLRWRPFLSEGLIMVARPSVDVSEITVP